MTVTERSSTVEESATIENAQHRANTSTQAHDTAPSIGDLIANYSVLDTMLDELEERAKQLRIKREAVKLAIKINLDLGGVDKASAHGLTVSIREKWRAKYDPEKWPGVVAWAIGEGHAQIVQRRLTDAAVMELVDNGVPLPDGLSVEPYKDLDVRRTK